jgi:predicted small integral membrane protein
MRHVMALRVSKAVLVFAIALFYTILVLNNLTDYGSNYGFVRHVLMMDSTFPGNHLMWRAVNSPLVHTVFYIGIIAWESVTMLLCWWAGVRLLKSYRADGAPFATALNLAVIALTTSLLMWLVAFLDVGGNAGTDGTFTNFHLLKSWQAFRQSPIFSGLNGHSDLNSPPEPTDAMRIRTARLPQD